MFSYTAFELGIHSEIPLPELTPVDNTPKDVVVRLQKLTNPEEGATRRLNVFFGETPGVATFLVRNGEEIIVDPVPDVDELLLGTILLGPVLSLLLRQRGLAVLHASAVVGDGSAVAFVGDSGWGKSTLAEAFYKRGYGVITDDVLAVSVDRNRPEALPGYPSIKLFPDIANYLDCERTATHKVNSLTEKRAHCVAANFPDRRLPLQLIYILAGGDHIQIEPLQPQEVFVELVRNARGLCLLRDSDSLNAHMRQCARIIAGVPVVRLRRRPDLSFIPDLVGLIEKDLAQKSSP